MSKPSAERFLELVSLSRLVETDRLDKTVAVLRESDPEALSDSVRLAKFFIESQLLTRWQCSHLLNGRYKDFFLGDYKLMDRIVTTNAAGFYLATHRLTSSQYTVEILPPKRVDGWHYKARLVR